MHCHFSDWRFSFSRESTVSVGQHNGLITALSDIVSTLKQRLDEVSSFLSWSNLFQELTYIPRTLIPFVCLQLDFVGSSS
jgi:hypothetical protein